MHSSPETSLTAAERARWLAELALAVDQAQRLATEIAASEARRSEAGELHAQLEAIRVEVEMLRRGRPEGDKIDPNWINLFGWNERHAG